MATENLEIIIGANTQDLQTGLNQASQSVTNFGNAVRANTRPTADATNALSNLSRVAQDAPYGFMGIANNLNPLLESFQRLQAQTGSATTALKAMVAGLSGPAGIGVALGVASSLIVAFGDEIDAFFTKLDEGSDSSIRYKEALKGIGTEFTGATEKVSDVKIAFEQYHKGILTGEQALRIYNAELGKSLGVKDNINDAEATFVAKSAAYVEAQFQRALADQASKKAAEELLKAKLLQETGGEKSGTLAKTIALVIAPALPKPLTDKLFGIYDEKKFENDLSKANDLYEAFNKIKERALEKANQIDKDAAIATSKTEIAQNEKDRKALEKSTTKKTSIDVDTSTLERLKKEQQLYKDDFYLYKDYADKIALETKKIEQLKTQGSKNAANELIEIDKTYGIQLEINKKELGDKLTKLFDDQDKKWVEKRKADNKKLLDAEKDFYSNNIRNIKDNLDLENKLADDDYNKKKENTKKAMALLSVSLLAPGLNKKTIQELLDAYDELAKKLKLLGIDEQQKDTKNLQEGYKKFADVIAKDVTGAFMTMFDAMQQGKNPLQALGDYFTNLGKQIAAAAIEAAVFQGIMMLLNPASAGSFGGGFFEGFKKILGFAEGGIVSQPTIAMVGEGGQSEAIMPLNKLGNMMNSTFNAGAMSGGSAGGNGQFVLKGQDLILAINRSNASLNLRRGF
jgi:hypothetical protein